MSKNGASGGQSDTKLFRLALLLVGCLGYTWLLGFIQDHVLPVKALSLFLLSMGILLTIGGYKLVYSDGQDYMYRHGLWSLKSTIFKNEEDLRKFDRIRSVELWMCGIIFLVIGASMVVVDINPGALDFIRHRYEDPLYFFFDFTILVTATSLTVWEVNRRGK